MWSGPHKAAYDFCSGAIAVAILLFMFLSPGYDHDFICKSDLGS